MRERRGWSDCADSMRIIRLFKCLFHETNQLRGLMGIPSPFRYLFFMVPALNWAYLIRWPRLCEIHSCTFIRNSQLSLLISSRCKICPDSSWIDRSNILSYPKNVFSGAQDFALFHFYLLFFLTAAYSFRLLSRLFYFYMATSNWFDISRSLSYICM